MLHLLSLTLGFGAVLSTDRCALSGLVRRRGFTLARAVRVAAVLDSPIWAGYLGLIVSGLLLRPDLGLAPMWVELGAALPVGLNGVDAQGGVMRSMSPPVRRERPPCATRRS